MQKLRSLIDTTLVFSALVVLASSLSHVMAEAPRIVEIIAGEDFCPVVVDSAGKRIRPMGWPQLDESHRFNRKKFLLPPSASDYYAGFTSCGVAAWAYTDRYLMRPIPPTATTVELPSVAEIRERYIWKVLLDISPDYPLAHEQYPVLRIEGMDAANRHELRQRELKKPGLRVEISPFGALPEGKYRACLAAKQTYTPEQAKEATKGSHWVEFQVSSQHWITKELALTLKSSP